MNEVDVAWAAGFLEGEGCFGWYGDGTRRKAKPHLKRTANAVIAVCQNEREPLDRLQSIFGAGRINPKRNPKRVAWEWRCQGHAAIPVMKAVYSHMSKRRQQRIREVIESYDALQSEIAHRKVICRNGHLFSEHGVNRTDGRGHYCAECHRQRETRRRAQKKTG